MTEELKEELEEETPSQEEWEEPSQDEEEAQDRVYTFEEVEALKKKMQSDSEKGVQKLLKTTRMLEEWYKVLDKNSDDANYLIEVYYDNPELAKVVLDKFYWWRSIEEYKEYFWLEEDPSDPKVLERRAEKKAQKILEQRTIQDKTNAFIDKLKMSEEEKEQFLEAFDERKQLKSFKLEDLEKHLEKAYKEIADDEAIKKLRQTEMIWKSISMQEWNKWGNSPKKVSDRNSEWNKNFLKERWIL